MSKLGLKTIDLSNLNGSILYKTKGGFIKNAALWALDTGIISIRIPRILGTTSLNVCIFCDGDATEQIFSAKWNGASCDFDLYEAEVTFPRGLYFYRLELTTPFGKIFGLKCVKGIYFSRTPDGATFQLTVSSLDDEYPEDFLGGTIYHVFVDRFAKRGDGLAKPGTILADYSDGIPEYPEYPGAELKNNTFYGGSLYGVIDKLDYIESLGANIIYLSPIFESPSNHKYDTSDYMHVDPAFGGDAALEELISKARERNIKIILDGVFNHTGADSIYFNRYANYDSLGAYQSKESPYYSWFDFKSHPDKYTCWWDIEILPRINTRNPDCESYFVGKDGVIEKYAKMGIDGFRLDVADELSDDFIKKIKKTLSANSKGSILYGEVWEDASNKIAYSERKHYYQGGELDGVMNYPLRRGIIDYVTKKGKEALAYALGEVATNAPERIMHLQMNLLGTHDTERILTTLGGDSAVGFTNDQLVKKHMSASQRKVAKKRLKMAYSILATLPGIPTIFYGDEAGLEGYSDPFNRMPYPWGKEDKEILDFYKKIGIIRKYNYVFASAPLTIHSLTDDTLIFSRSDGKKTIVTVINNSDAPLELDFSSKATDLMSNTALRSFTLEDEGAMIIECCAESTLTVGSKKD